MPNLTGSIGAILMAGGMLVLVIAGWDPVFARVHAPILLEVGWNTALCFIAVGTALLAEFRVINHEWLTRAAWFMVLLATLALFQGLLGIAPPDGPWRLLVNTVPPEAAISAWPGRMSLTTALGLLIAGGIMANLRRIDGTWASVAALLALGLLLGLALTALSLKFLNIDLFNEALPVPASLSLPTSVGLLLLWLGLIPVSLKTWLGRYFLDHPERRILSLAGLSYGFCCCWGPW